MISKRSSSAKGKALESFVDEYLQLQKIDHVKCESSGRGKNKGDLQVFCDDRTLVLECKSHRTSSLKAWIKQADEQAEIVKANAKHKTEGIVVYKPHGSGLEPSKVLVIKTLEQEVSHWKQWFHKD